MKEYKGFKYQQMYYGWKVVLPSGVKLRCKLKTEAEVKAEIDRMADV